MNAAKLKRILGLATRAPSSDNAQPFYFEWEDDQLLVLHDDERAKRRGNAGNCASWIALGCLLESIEIAASGESAKPEFRLIFDSPEHGAAWVEVDFVDSERSEDPLLPGLAIRCSDRRPYRGGDLSHPVFETIRTDVARYQRCQLHFQAQPDTALIDYILACEEFLWRDPYVLTDVLKWVRWNKKEVEETRDGVFWRGLGIPYFISRMMKLAYQHEGFRAFLRRTGAPMRSQRQVGADQIQSSAALACFSVRDTQPESLIAVGQAFLRTWVALNQAGYGVQVMANPSLHVFQQVAGLIPSDYPESSLQTFARGRKVLTNSFGIDPGEIPAWMFRTGISSQLPASWRTLRRHLSEVVQEPSGRKELAQPS